MTSAPKNIGSKPVILEPQPHGGALLRSGGPGRPKTRDTVVGRIRAALESEEPDKAILDALIAKAVKGDTKAIELCLHYGIGKPTDKVEVSGPEGGPIQSQSLDLTDRERSALQDAIDAELKRRAEESAD